MTTRRHDDVKRGYFEEWSRKANLFVKRQQAEQLRRALKYWPNSEHADARRQELYDLESEIKKLEEN